MTNILSRYYTFIQRATGTLFQMHNGEQISHSELQISAERILPIVLKNVDGISSSIYDAILSAVIDQYEVEVGIKVYDPNFLVKDKLSKYWLVKRKSSMPPYSYFNRYKVYLGKREFSQKTIQSIESTCEQILSYCADPENGANKKKGLVVGDVQSGKTANYLGLINMAFDYGYRIVVLLAGSTDSLRLQTQKRTDAGVIGAISDSIGNSIEYIGVGVPGQSHYAIPFTNQKYDFKKFLQKNINATFSDFRKPVVLVVKKNGKILESVSERLQAELSDKGVTDTKSVLIIDDEADYASVNTKKPGNDPSTINKLVRTIFNKFPIASYVGYTATPFANIFINPFDVENNRDLFPSDFIVQLNASSAYFGGRKVFPKDEEDVAKHLKVLSEEEEFFLPVIHEKEYRYEGMPDSLKEAVYGFLINCVIRSIRGQQTKHRSMMINITRFNDVQSQIEEAVTNFIELLTCEIEQLGSRNLESFIANRHMKALYEVYTNDRFYKDIREGAKEKDIEKIEWQTIQAGLYDEIKQFKITVINSRNGTMTQRTDDNRKKRFDYDEYKDDGARVIAIGGMVLSRGLTLEGLMVSYYSRNASAYDALLQMGRWFGYRQGYEDLCRLYISQENIDRFDAVLDAVEDLKLQFAEMERNDKTPEEFGLMVRESPETLETTLLVTARNKMIGSESIFYHLNYGGVYADTSKLRRDLAENEHNYRATVSFINGIPFGYETGPEKQPTYYMARNVHKFKIASLIGQLKIPYINKKFDTEGLAEYIENSEQFNSWDVVIATGDSKEKSFPNSKIHRVLRSFHIKNSNDEYIRIGGSNNRVMEPTVFNAGLWLTEEQKRNILEEKNKNVSDDKKSKNLGILDYLKEREDPILIIYPIELTDRLTSSEETDLSDADKHMFEQEKKKICDSFTIPLMAYAIGFPAKQGRVMVKYRANKIKLQELEHSELNDDEEGEDDDNE